MTEKRFTMDYEPTYRDYIYLDNDTVLTEKEVLNLLNAQHEENEQLKQQIEQDIKDILLCQSFITDKGYSLQDLKDWDDLRKELRGEKND